MEFTALLRGITLNDSMSHGQWAPHTIIEGINCVQSTVRYRRWVQCGLKKILWLRGRRLEAIAQMALVQAAVARGERGGESAIPPLLFDTNPHPPVPLQILAKWRFLIEAQSTTSIHCRVAREVLAGSPRQAPPPPSGANTNDVALPPPQKNTDPLERRGAWWLWLWLWSWFWLSVTWDQVGTAFVLRGSVLWHVFEFSPVVRMWTKGDLETGEPRHRRPRTLLADLHRNDLNMIFT